MLEKYFSYYFQDFGGGCVCTWVCVYVWVPFKKKSVFCFQVVRKLAWPGQLPTRAIPARLWPLLLPPIQRWPLHVHRPQLRLDRDEGRAGPTAGQLSLPAATGIHVPTHSTAHHAAVPSFVLAGVLVFIICDLSLMSLHYKFHTHSGFQGCEPVRLVSGHHFDPLLKKEWLLG